MYTRKKVVLREHSKGYSKGGGLCGVLSLLCDEKNISCVLELKNADARRYGTWHLALKVNDKFFFLEITDLEKFNFSLQMTKLNAVSALVCVKTNKLSLVSFGGSDAPDSYDRPLFLYASQRAFPPPPRQKEEELVKEAPAEKESEPSTQYERFVLTTDNYYDSSEGKKLLSRYKQAMDDFYTLPKGTFYTKVKSQLLSIFDAYPRYPILMEAIDNSLFVRINRKRGHFCLGLLIEEGAPRYICYALPQDINEEPNSAKEYTYIFQDAGSGELSRLKSFN